MKFTNEQKHGRAVRMATKVKKAVKAKKAVKRQSKPRVQIPMLTAGQTVDVLSEMTGISKVDIRHVLDELHNLTVEQIGQGHKFRLAGLVQLQPRLKAATKARMGRNPRTGEAVEVSAKPESVVVGMRRLKPLTEAAPKIKTLKAVLEG
jgi:nucleoid DNA-binding protein